jgi:hypothetical protein
MSGAKGFPNCTPGRSNLGHNRDQGERSFSDGDSARAPSRVRIARSEIDHGLTKPKHPSISE